MQARLREHAVKPRAQLTELGGDSVAAWAPSRAALVATAGRLSAWHVLGVLGRRDDVTGPGIDNEWAAAALAGERRAPQYAHVVLKGDRLGTAMGACPGHDKNSLARATVTFLTKHRH
jgi:hypothetical protein